MDVKIVGSATRAVFGQRADDHVRRQWREAAATMPAAAALTLVARSDVTACAATIGWLVENPGALLVDEGGQRLMMATAAPPADDCGDDPWPAAASRAVSGSFEVYSRKLRRHQPVEALDLRRLPRVVAERTLFDLVYKGVTDLVTRYVWPVPAFHVVRGLAAIHVRPNLVTVVGALLMMLAALFLWQSRWELALAAAWAMSFLDTVDGKLARVTGQSSELGNVLDHGMDIVHPPIWWICLAHGAAADWSSIADRTVFASSGVILLMYLVGRVSEEGFKIAFGFNQFMWTPFDGALRLVIARRNTILAIVTIGALAGDAGLSVVAAAAWSVVSIGLQTGRTLLAWNRRARGQPIRNCLQDMAGAPA